MVTNNDLYLLEKYIDKLEEIRRMLHDLFELIDRVENADIAATLDTTLHNLRTHLTTIEILLVLIRDILSDKKKNDGNKEKTSE